MVLMLMHATSTSEQGQNAVTDIYNPIREGRTPLCYANSGEVFDQLLGAGADVKIIDKNGWSVIMNFIANKSRLPNRT